MSIDRRSVLKGIALSGITGLTTSSPVLALAGDGSVAGASAGGHALLVVANEGAAGETFLQGAMAVSGTGLRVQRYAGDLTSTQNFVRQLRTGQPMRIIGLLDDAAATLLIDAARSVGATMQWLGQHTAAEAGFTRHRLVTTDLAEGCSRQLSRHLSVCSAGFSLTEERQNGEMTSHKQSRRTRSIGSPAQWTTIIGSLLASPGTGEALAAPPARDPGTIVTGSFVSFSLEA